MKSVFIEKTIIPSDSELKKVLGSTYKIWHEISEHVMNINQLATQEWKYSGDKYGWGFRINDKKRVLVYLLPRDGFFRVAFVFGQKASEVIMESTISESIKDELRSAKPHAEGRGIRIEIRDSTLLKDIWNLIKIKITH